MGSFDGAETCELIGLFILSQLQNLNINVGLYRDDGLAICDKSPTEIETIKKEICRIFKENHLRITIEANLKAIDFLDITMDLRSGVYKPFMKPNNTPLYVHKNSNHPPNIIRNIPESINKRLSTISSNESVFNNAATDYQEALKSSGYHYKLKYDPPQQPNNANGTNRRKRNRNRNASWFNPPYSENASTNIGNKFLKLVDKCFPPEHKLHKLINRNTVKVSYSCMPNIKQVILNHNRATMKPNKTQDTPKDNCNCRRNKECPLNKQCLTTSVIYQATVTTQDTQKEDTYIGLTENTFKSRYNGHSSSFDNDNNKKATSLSKHIWTLKDKKIDFSVKWKIVAKGTPFSVSSKKCILCIKEKYFIICKPNMCTLNNRNELASECRHRKNHLLSHLK